MKLWSFSGRDFHKKRLANDDIGPFIDVYSFCIIYRIYNNGPQIFFNLPFSIKIQTFSLCVFFLVKEQNGNDKLRHISKIDAMYTDKKTKLIKKQR